MKVLFFLLFYITFLLSMPQKIQDYQSEDIQEADASYLKDIISPTKDIHSSANEIYKKELEDLEVTLEIEKFRILQSKHQTFLVNKKISLEDILLDVQSINEFSNTIKVSK
ncbi:hypothetical protein CRU99_13115 [Malaciobacter mytili]|uniref:hypothetical protein n=1 Tax=Malaciobacter mytili TaxID=603050 RepID=UPI00100B5BB5|nr:hypothetical protein [Malaciobacter mytili]RXI36941.1 hypothetical protein CRU99_13115 [Malaciobacter mytili]